MDITEQNRICFVKALIGAVWLDKTITADILNVLVTYIRRLDLSEEETVDLKPYFTKIMRDREATRLVENFVNLLPNLHPVDRDTFIDAVSSLKELEWSDEPDDEFLDNLPELLGYLRDVGDFVGKARELLKRGGIAAPKEEEIPTDNLDDFLRTRIMHSVRSKMLDLDIGHGELSNREVSYITSLSALLGRIAHADEDFCQEEKIEIANLLKESTSLSHTDIDVIMETIVDETLRGMDLKSITRTYYNMSTDEQRETLLNCLFLVAGADGHIDPCEVDEIERIAVSLHMSHRDILRAKSNAMRVVQERLERQAEGVRTEYTRTPDTRPDGYRAVASSGLPYADEYEPTPPSGPSEIERTPPPQRSARARRDYREKLDDEPPKVLSVIEELQEARRARKARLEEILARHRKQKEDLDINDS